MGRRKIEIKAIKDDRNRSVTFLKRKGGLFKKAHELSVLCSVDVAVIIFGHNKKLYEFSSGDINETIGRYQYYGNAHEHKGPADFNGKKDLDDDDDDDMGSPAPESHSSQDHPMIPPHHLQNQPGYQHMRQQAPSASPPIPNGILPNGLPYHPRHSTPQPQQVMSRPGSRNNVRRQSSLVPQHHPQTTQPPTRNGFAYMPNPYNPQAGAGMLVGPQQAPQAHFQYPHPPPHPQAQIAFMGEQRRESVPPQFAQQDRPQNLVEASPPQQERSLENNQHLQKPVPAKSRSIFTPIDDSRSSLAQYWGNTTASEAPRTESVVKTEGGVRSQSVEVGLVSRNATGPTAPPPRPQRVSTQPQRTASISSDIRPISRTNSAQINAKRPKLSVQIPSEQSDGGSGTAESSPRESADTTGGTPAKAGTDGSHSSGVLLPPPSPSAGTILSAGASGPPNPFARPHPPNATTNNNANAFSNNNNNNSIIDTPISALPSRFMSDGLLPSPSSFYPGWDFGRGGGDSNLLPSPLNFQTPIVGPNYLREEEGTTKRKSPEGEMSDGGNGKRVKI